MDRQQTLVETVRASIEAQTPMAIRGGNSKAFYGAPVTGETLDLSGHEGIIDYDPVELGISCRAGSRLEEIRQLLADNGQHLPFEPPAFGDKATIGGTVACGFSGPGRPWAGSLRDYLLGVKLINGKGEALKFGGQVMKNVAGYDVSRLMAGSMGTLGVLLEVSFKVLPQPAESLTLGYACGQDEAIGRVSQWSAQPLPLSAACWQNGQLSVRLAGAGSEVDKAAALMAPETRSTDMVLWENLREHRMEFFTGSTNLWRISVPAATPPLELEGDCLLDWGGAQRWYCGPEEPEKIRSLAGRAGGHATLFRGESEAPRFHPLPAGLRQLHQRIRQAFDPYGLFNPGRLDQGA